MPRANPSTSTSSPSSPGPSSSRRSSRAKTAPEPPPPASEAATSQPPKRYVLTGRDYVLPAEVAQAALRALFLIEEGLYVPAPTMSPDAVSIDDPETLMGGYRPLSEEELARLAGTSDIPAPNPPPPDEPQPR